MTVNWGDVGTWVGGIGSAAAAVAAFLASRKASTIAREDRQAVARHAFTERQQDGLERRLDLQTQVALTYESVLAARFEDGNRDIQKQLGRMRALIAATGDESLEELVNLAQGPDHQQGRELACRRVDEVRGELDSLQFDEPA